MRDGKKVLLVLGGLSVICDVVEKAQNKGYYVIVTDYLKNSPAKRIADESWMLSIDDVDGIVAKCRESGVDGVMNYCIDPGQKPYQQICEKLGLPCVAGFEQFDIMTNKDKFKECCIKHGVGTIPYYPFNGEITDDFLNSIEFPVMVKPADSRASKGLKVCYAKEELNASIEYALSFSKRKKVIIEKYMSGCPETIIKYVACDGNIYLTSMSNVFDCVTDDGIRVYMGTQTYPSKYYHEFIGEQNDRVIEMLKDIGIRNGAMSLTGFYDKGMFRFFDPSLRMGGAQDWRIVKAACGLDISDMLTNFALFGSMGNADDIKKIDKAFADKYSAMLYFDIRPGTITEFSGINQVAALPYVIGYHQCHEIGDTVHGYGTADNVAIRFLLSCNTRDELISTMREAQGLITIRDAEGNDLIVSPFNPELV